MQTNKFWTAVSKGLAVMTVTLIMAVILAPGASAAGKYKVIYEFAGGTDAGQPEGTPILDSAGNLYATATAGGLYGSGAVFELTKNSDGTWTESVLYSFAGGSDGASPESELTFDASGNLYGTTCYGGAYSAGTVFQLVPGSDGTWTENQLYSFTGGSDGANPYYGVIFDATGTLYSATSGGGVQGQGVVYKLTPNSDGSWTYGLLHSFTGGSDGSYPLYQGALTFDTAGNLYGATSDGVNEYGGCSPANDCGSIFEMTPQSGGTWNEQVIFRFDGAHGVKPTGPLMFDSAGRLYGHATGGGGNYGNVFKLTLSAKGRWHEDVLHTFQGNQDGAYPGNNLAFDKVGNLYGTTDLGEDRNGNCCFGQVYELVRHTHGFSKRVVHYFHGGSDGVNSGSGVLFDAAWNLYGESQDGGSTGNGVVFEYIK